MNNLNSERKLRKKYIKTNKKIKIKVEINELKRKTINLVTNQNPTYFD